MNCRDQVKNKHRSSSGTIGRNLSDHTEVRNVDKSIEHINVDLSGEISIAIENPCAFKGRIG